MTRAQHDGDGTLDENERRVSPETTVARDRFQQVSSAKAACFWYLRPHRARAEKSPGARALYAAVDELWAHVRQLPHGVDSLKSRRRSTHADAKEPEE